MPDNAISEAKHLWEIKHSYSCDQVNHYEDKFDSWDEFTREHGDADMDYNLLFRFDWYEGYDYGAGSCPYTGDDKLRNGILQLSWLRQRMGRYEYSLIHVSRSDEPKVITFLAPRMKHLIELWLPLHP